MDIKFRREGNTLIVFMHGEIDHHTAIRAKEKIDGKFMIEPVKNMIIDLLGVTFMDSAGIGLIYGRISRVKAVGGRIIIRNPRPEITKILKISGLDSKVEIQTI